MVDLTLLAPRTNVHKALGVVADKVNNNVAIDINTTKCLQYPLPNMDQSDIAQYLSYNELHFIAGDPGNVEYESMLEDEKARYDNVGQSWEDELDAEGPKLFIIPLLM